MDYWSPAVRGFFLNRSAAVVEIVEEAQRYLGGQTADLDSRGRLRRYR